MAKLRSHRKARSRLIPLCACILFAGMAPAIPAAASTTHSLGEKPYSSATLLSVMARIPNAQPWATIVRSTLSQWYVDARADRVVVGLTRITSAARAASRHAFGGAVQLTVAPRASLTVRNLGTATRLVRLPSRRTIPNSSGGVRRNDGSPFYGGDEIISYVKEGTKYDVVQCTSSFDAYDTLNKWNVMLTAGHCSADFPSDTWYSGYISGQTFYVGAKEGTIDDETFNNKDPDAMTITQEKLGTFSAHVFVGSATSSTNYPLDGSDSFKTGELICTDGVDSGAAICGPSVTHTGMCVVFKEGSGTINVCDLAEATYSKAFCIPGDSGGPVYVDMGTTKKVYALGTIEGSTTGENNCYMNELGPALSVTNARLDT